MGQLRSIALSYDSREDRLFASVNPAAPDACGFWLTRRVVLDIVARLPPVLAQYSPAVRQAAVEHRPEVAAFEREAAVADEGGGHFTQTPDELLRKVIPEAELLSSLSVNVRPEGVAVDLLGSNGRQASGVWTRDDVQRLLHLLQQEVLKAGWMHAAGPASAPAAPAPPKRH
jgi:hypothetical protein